MAAGAEKVIYTATEVAESRIGEFAIANICGGGRYFGRGDQNPGATAAAGRNFAAEMIKIKVVLIKVL